MRIFTTPIPKFRTPKKLEGYLRRLHLDSTYSIGVRNCMHAGRSDAEMADDVAADTALTADRAAAYASAIGSRRRSTLPHQLREAAYESQT